MGAFFCSDKYEELMQIHCFDISPNQFLVVAEEMPKTSATIPQNTSK